MRLTHSNIHALETEAGAFSRATLHTLGVSWPPKKGWLERLVGTEIDEETYRRAHQARELVRKRYGHGYNPAQQSLGF